MRIRLIILLVLTGGLTQAQTFPGTDSLRGFNNRYIRNSAIEAFTNMRLNTLLKGVINELDSIKAGSSAFDSTSLSSRINGKADTANVFLLDRSINIIDGKIKQGWTGARYAVTIGSEYFDMKPRISLYDGDAGLDTYNGGAFLTNNTHYLPVVGPQRIHAGYGGYLNLSGGGISFMSSLTSDAAGTTFDPNDEYWQGAPLFSFSRSGAIGFYGLAGDGDGILMADNNGSVTKVPSFDSTYIYDSIAAVAAGIPSFATQAQLDTIIEKNNIAVWGNSLTEGHPAFPWPEQLSRLTGRYVYNGGVSGQTSPQIRARMIADSAKYGWPTIIWSGNNNATDTVAIHADIKQMVDSLGHQNYLILGIVKGDYSNRYAGTEIYNTIENLNDSLEALYGERFVRIQEWLMSNYDPEDEGDITDIANGVIPGSLRVDDIHLNQTGYNLVAQYIYDNYRQYLTYDPGNVAAKPGDIVDLLSGKMSGSFVEGLTVRNTDLQDAFEVDAAKKTTTFFGSGEYSDTGTNIITNGDFSNGLTGWTATNWTDGIGKATHNTGNTSALSQDIPMVVSRMYVVSYTVSGRTAGSVLAEIDGNDLTNLVWIPKTSEHVSANGTYTFAFRWPGVGGTKAITFTPTSNFDGSISNVSVKRLVENSSDIIKLASGADNTATVRIFGNNYAIGSSIMNYIQSTAIHNTGFGNDALKRLSFGTGNTAFGSNVLSKVGNGIYNTAGGYGSLFNLEDGSYNTGWGANALASLTSGIGNVGIGPSAGNHATGLSFDNTFIGYGAGSGTSGMVVSRNTIIGMSAGSGINTGATDNTLIGRSNSTNVGTGDKNISIGYNIALPVTNGSNQLNIGNIIFGTGVSGQNTTIAGNIGIGLNNPSERLEVSGNIKATQFKLSELNTAPSSATDTGTAGEIRVTADYIYVCVSENVWVRSELTTW